MLHGLNPRTYLPSYIKTTGPERHWLTLVVPKDEQRLPDVYQAGISWLPRGMPATNFKAIIGTAEFEPSLASE